MLVVEVEWKCQDSFSSIDPECFSFSCIISPLRYVIAETLLLITFFPRSLVAFAFIAITFHQISFVWVSLPLFHFLTLSCSLTDQSKGSRIPRLGWSREGSASELRSPIVVARVCWGLEVGRRSFFQRPPNLRSASSSRCAAPPPYPDMQEIS